MRFRWATWVVLCWCVAAHATRVAPARSRTDHTKLGQGPARNKVVYFHGFADRPDGPVGNKVLEALKRSGQSVELIRLNLRPQKGAHRFSQSLQLAREWMRQNEGKVRLVGHSLGGKIAIQIAQEFPDKIEKLVPLAPGVGTLERHWHALAGARPMPDKKTFAAVFGARRRKLAKAARQAPADKRQAANFHVGVAGLMKEMAGYDEARAENGLSVPISMVAGTTDKQVPIEFARRFVKQNQNSTLREVAGVNHNFQSRDPKVEAAVLEAIGEALR